MTDSAYAEFQRLCEKRDLAAYRAVGAIGAVIDFFEAQDYASALASLKQAREEFREADSLVTEFLNSKKENSTDGNRTAA